MNCERCGEPMKALLTSMYCDCVGLVFDEIREKHYTLGLTFDEFRNRHFTPEMITDTLRRQVGIINATRWWDSDDPE